MLGTLDATHSLISNHEMVRGLLGTYGREDLQAWRDENLERFLRAGFPTHKDEEFKYTNVRAIEETVFQPAYGAVVSREELQATSVGAIGGVTLVFVNGEHAPELSDVQGLPSGVAVISLKDAFEQFPEQVEKHLGKIATLEGKLGSSNDERFVWLNNAYVSEGAFIYIPKGVAVETPIHLLFLSQADHGVFAAHPRVLVVAEENSQAKIIESYIGLEGTYFNNAVTEFWIDRHANVEHTKVQQETDTAFHVATVQADQEEGSVYSSNTFTVGGKISRNDINMYIHGEHTESWMYGVYMGTREQVLDNHTRIDHALPNCHSFEVYKGILADRAIGVFNGKIFVYEDAQKTDAKQTNQALLLSPTATVNTKPQLEIFADDVKCTHGATVGQLREDALFYLRSRGIPESHARGLLVYAFAAEALQRVTVEPLREVLEKALFAKLHDQTEVGKEL